MIVVKQPGISAEHENTGATWPIFQSIAEFTFVLRWHGLVSNRVLVKCKSIFVHALKVQIETLPELNKRARKVYMPADQWRVDWLDPCIGTNLDSRLARLARPTDESIDCDLFVECRTTVIPSAEASQPRLSNCFERSNDSHNYFSLVPIFFKFMIEVTDDIITFLGCACSIAMYEHADRVSSLCLSVGCNVSLRPFRSFAHRRLVHDVRVGSRTVTFCWTVVVIAMSLP